MREDIRLLGAILGDTVREQSGEEVFDLVERPRGGLPGAPDGDRPCRVGSPFDEVDSTRRSR